MKVEIPFTKIITFSIFLLFAPLSYSQFSNLETQRLWDQMRLMDLEDKVNRIEWDNFEKKMQSNRNMETNNNNYTTPKSVILPQAKFWNLSPNEFVRRDQIGNNECFYRYGFNEYSGYCWQSKILNISIVEVQKRNRKIEIQCNKSSDPTGCLRNILVLGK
jgi:hypothetical protein